MAKDGTTRGGGSRTGGGGSGGQPMVNGRWLPVTLRVRVVKEVLEHGAKVADVARVFGVGVATINGWCRVYQEGGPEALIPKPPSVRFDLSNESMAVLASVPGLYSWRQPERPEDLCLLRRDGSPWMGSIAHERDSFLELEEAEMVDLRAGVPGLELASDAE